MNSPENLLKRIACLLVFLACSAALPAAPAFELMRGLTVAADGSMRLGEVTMLIQHFSPGSLCASQTRQSVSGTPVLARDSWELDGRFVTRADAKEFSLAQKITRTRANEITYQTRLNSPEPIPTVQLALAVNLPINLFTDVPLQLDNETFVLPATAFTKTQRWRAVKRLICPTPQGRLIVEGPLDVQLQDGRNFADKRDFRLRFLFTPESGDVRDASLAFAFRVEPYGPKDAKPRFDAGRGVTMEANEDWQPLEHHLSARAGSVLDWSRMSDAPAGKHGWVVVRDGHFSFEKDPSRRVRFFGANICNTANYLSKQDCETLATQLVRQGYNAVRLHHYDRHLVKAGRTIEAGWDSDALDQFDYLFHCLKRAGLYINIDLYTVRKVTAAEIEEVDRDVSLGEFKALAAISPSARANWKEFARRLLTHVNPYTGLAWKDDPALFGICLLNEDNTTANWNAAPDIAALYEKRFAEWQRKMGKSAGSRDQQWAAFLIETHLNMMRELTAFLRELGVRALITDANYRQELALGLIRRELDYVDNHDYHDLRKFLGAPFTLPYGFHHRSAVAEQAVVPRRLFAARQFGKPYTVTEFNYCYPNKHRAEGGPLMGAYAALQDWDGLFRYAYGHTPQNATSPQPIVHLDNASDPLNLLADRIVALLFRRGDVRPATSRIPYRFPESCFEMPNPLERPQGFAPEDFERLGLIAQVGSEPVAHGAKASARVPDHLAQQISSGKTSFLSETGEIRLGSAEGRLSVVTPRTECFVLAGAETVRGNFMEIRNQGGFAVLELSHGLPSATRRYSRVQLCATWSGFNVHCLAGVIIQE